MRRSAWAAVVLSAAAAPYVDGWLMSYPATVTDTMLGHADHAAGAASKLEDKDVGGVGGSAGSFGADFPQPGGTPTAPKSSFATMLGLGVPDEQEAASAPGQRPLAILTTPPGMYRDSTSRSLQSPPPELDSSCTPEDQPFENQCHYLQVSAVCWKDRQSQPFDFKSFYYCSCGGHLVGLVPLIIMLLLIFYTLAQAADKFFCPAVDDVSEMLKLPPDVAGATLLSFGNGAPDVFTQIAAITQGAKPDVLLALSSCLGSGLFITCVVLACVIMAAPQPLQLDWTFRRDTIAYLFAVLLILGVMVDGKVEFYQSSLLFAYYIGYLCMVIFFGTTSDVDDDEENVPYKPHGIAVREFGVHPTLMWFRNVVRWELKSTTEKIFSPLTVPVDVVMNLTMTTEEPGRVFGAVLAICAPIFFLTSIGVEPGEHSRFFFIFFSMIALSAAMWATSSVELVSGKWLVPTLTFVQSVLWMKLCAGMLVELLGVIGAVVGMSPAFLGATVLAWGSSVADLAANAAVARKNPKMAVSACFSGPLFNLLAGMSVSLIYQNMSSGDVFVVLDNPALIIILATALCMLLMAVVIPQEKYVMGRHWITLLAVFYVAFNIAYVLNQMGWLWSNPWLAAPSKA